MKDCGAEPRTFPSWFASMTCRRRSTRSAEYTPCLSMASRNSLHEQVSKCCKRACAVPRRDPAVLVRVECNKRLVCGQLLQLQMRVQEVERSDHVLLTVIQRRSQTSLPHNETRCSTHESTNGNLAALFIAFEHCNQQRRHLILSSQ